MRSRDPTNRVQRKFRASNIAVEQTFLKNNLGVELAYDNQWYGSRQDFLFAGGSGTSTAGPTRSGSE